MYTFTITRFGETGPKHDVPRKTENGAVTFAWKWLEKHGCHGDEINVVKKRCRKACRTFIYTVRDHKNVKLGSNGVKEKPAPFGKEPSVKQKRIELLRVMRRMAIREKRRAQRDPTYTIKREMTL